MYYKLKLDKHTPPAPINIMTPIPTNKSISFGQLIKEGIAFGTSSYIAKNVAEKAMNAQTTSLSNNDTANTNANATTNNNNKNKCGLLKKQFDRCLYKDTENNCTYIKNLYEKSCKNKKD